MKNNPLEITLPSDLRTVLIQIESLKSMMRPNFTVQPVMITVLETAIRDLTKVTTAATAWMEEIQTERFQARTASLKASLSKSLRPPLVRRRRR